MRNSTSTTIGWIDLLRIIACFGVIVSHCCDGFVAEFEADRPAFLTGVFSGSLVRPCVPLFVMMTGVLLFPVRTDTIAFYRKRIGRILYPLVFWSILLPILFFIYFNYINPDTLNPTISLPQHDLHSLWIKLYTWIFNFNFDTVPMWYLYMLIGLYLVMPIFSSWLQNASRKEIKTVLAVWGINLFLPYIKMLAEAIGYEGNYGNMGILGVCDWNSYGSFYYLSGFIGYLILAYYLKKYPLNWNWNKTLSICIPLFLTGYLITCYGYILTQEFFPGNFAYLEIIWYFAGINVFMMTFPVFVIVQKANISPSKGLSRLASLAFGIYLCHYIFVFIGYDLFNRSNLPYIIRIIGMSLFTFLISYLVTWGMSKIKVMRKFIA